MRIFVAGYLEDASMTKILQVKHEIEDNGQGNFVPDDQLHLTLSFLGEIEASFISTIKEILDNLSLNIPSLTLKELTTFTRKNNETLIITFEPSSSLEKFRESFHNALKAYNINIDTRELRLHMTLARKLKITDKIKYDMMKQLRVCKVTLSHIALIKSTLQQNGPIHDPLFKKTNLPLEK